MPNSKSAHRKRPNSRQVRGYRDQRASISTGESEAAGAFPFPMTAETERGGARSQIGEPDSGDSPLPAARIRAIFKARPGSEFIASADAIAGLQRLICTRRPRSVLEIGSGIGTLTFTILDAYRALGVKDYRMVTVEGNAFCVSQLRMNLANEPRPPHVVDDVGAIAGEQFDLVIVDGGNEDDTRFLDFVAPRGMVFVEGYRAPQRSHIARSGRRYASANIRSLQQNHHRPSSVWGGAYWLYKFEPTLVERLTYARMYVWDGMLVTKRRALRTTSASTSLGMRRAWLFLSGLL